jgi:hypothetical protein
MLYAIPDTLLKVLLKGITYDMLASFIGINATVNNISAMIYNMAFSFIGV